MSHVRDVGTAAVAAATSYLMAGPEMAKAQQGLQAQYKEMLADPNVPDSVKQQIQAMMAQQGGGQTAFMAPMQELIKDISPSEMKLIEANLDRIVEVYQGLRK